MIQRFIERLSPTAQKRPLHTKESWLESFSTEDMERVNLFLSYVAMFDENGSGSRTTTVIAEGSTIYQDRPGFEDIDMRILNATDPRYPVRGRRIHQFQQTIEAHLSADALNFDKTTALLSSRDFDEGVSYTIFASHGNRHDLHIKTQDPNSRPTKEYLMDRAKELRPYILVYEPKVFDPAQVHPMY